MDKHVIIEKGPRWSLNAGGIKWKAELNMKQVRVLQKFYKGSKHFTPVA